MKTKYFRFEDCHLSLNGSIRISLSTPTTLTTHAPLLLVKKLSTPLETTPQVAMYGTYPLIHPVYLVEKLISTPEVKQQQLYGDFPNHTSNPNHPNYVNQKHEQAEPLTIEELHQLAHNALALPLGTFAGLS